MSTGKILGDRLSKKILRWIVTFFFIERITNQKWPNHLLMSRTHDSVGIRRIVIAASVPGIIHHLLVNKNKNEFSRPGSPAHGINTEPIILDIFAFCVLACFLL
jgi:hypothetical protein